MLKAFKYRSFLLWRQTLQHACILVEFRPNTINVLQQYAVLIGGWFLICVKKHIQIFVQKFVKIPNSCLFKNICEQELNNLHTYKQSKSFQGELCHCQAPQDLVTGLGELVRDISPYETRRGTRSICAGYDWNFKQLRFFINVFKCVFGSLCPKLLVFKGSKKRAFEIHEFSFVLLIDSITSIENDITDYNNNNIDTVDSGSYY